MMGFRVALRTYYEDPSIPPGKLRLSISRGITVPKQTHLQSLGILEEAVEIRTGKKTHSSTKRIHRIADSHQPGVKKIIKEASEAGRRALDPHAIVGTDVDAVVAAALLAMTKAYQKLPTLLYDVLVASGKASAVAADRKGNVRHAKLGFTFNAKDPKAIAWAKKHGAELVVQIGTETRNAIKSVIVRAQKDGLTTSAQAKLIRPMIGLTDRDSDAVYNRYIQLLESGESEDDALREAADYSEELLDARAERISRTETLAASNEGQRETWQQAVDEGFLSPNAQRIWIVADDDRLCPVCASMEGEKVGIDEPFDVDGELIDSPPAHPNCRCTQGIA